MRLITRLMTVPNGPKRTISIGGGLGSLQLVLEVDTERCASENADAGHQGVDVRPHSL